MNQDRWIDLTRQSKTLPAVLSGEELALLLTQMMRKKTSGRLTLAVGEVERTISFMQGMVSNIASNNPKETMAARFRGRRRLNKKQNDAVQELMEKEKIRFGQALVRLKVVDSETFAVMLAEHHA